MQNRLTTSFGRWNSSRYISMYSIVASVSYRQCAIRWTQTKFWTPYGASVKGILWPTDEFERVTAKTGIIMRPSSFIFVTLCCRTWLYGLLNRGKPGNGVIIAQSVLNLPILECCSRKNITQSIKWLSIPRQMVGRMLGTIIVVGEMHLIIQKMPSKVPTARCSRHCLASRLSVSSPWVVSIIFWKYSL